MRRILVTGKNGQVGWELQRALAPLGQVIALDVEDMDLSDPDSIRNKVREIAPHIIVNPAAHTAVDKAESEPELAMAINGIAPGVFAEEAKKLDALLIHYSTDYVFDGNKATPYTEVDVPNPQSVYGRTKLAGEEAIRSVGGKHGLMGRSSSMRRMVQTGSFSNVSLSQAEGSMPFSLAVANKLWMAAARLPAPAESFEPRTQPFCTCLRLIARPADVDVRATLGQTDLNDLTASGFSLSLYRKFDLNRNQLGSFAFDWYWQFILVQVDPFAQQVCIDAMCQCDL